MKLIQKIKEFFAEDTNDLEAVGLRRIEKWKPEEYKKLVEK